MTALPGYLLKARAVLEARQQAQCERSEESEKRSGVPAKEDASEVVFQAGRRYRIESALIGLIRRDPEWLEGWRIETGLPRAGIMRIAGQEVLVADVREAVRTGTVDVVGVANAVTGAKEQHSEGQGVIR